MPIAKQIHWVLLAGVLTAAMVLGTDGTTPGIAQPSPAAALLAKEQPAPEGLVLRVYDVKDLLLISLDHRFPGGMMIPATDVYETKSYYDQGYSPSGGIFGGHDARDANAMKARLVDLLQATVIWGDRAPDGPPVYQFAGSLLFIKQTPANHKFIEGILAEIRKTVARRRTITIRAWWLPLDAKELAQIVPDAGAKRTVPPEVSPDALKAMETAYRGETTCTEGQTVHIASGRGQTILSNATPIVADVVAFQPTINMVFWGAMLETTVGVAPEGDSATVDFRSVVTQPKELGMIPFVNMTPPPTTTAPVVYPKGLDRLDFAVWSQGATLRLPLGKPVIAGGMNGPEMKGKHLYLILEVTAAKN